MAAGLLVRALRPTTSGSLILLGAALALRTQLQRLSWLRLFLLWILFLNRRGLPFAWHLRLFAIGLRARLRYDAVRLRLWKGYEKQRRLGLKGDELAQSNIGADIFATVSARRARVSFWESDYNLHLSNSQYATAVDYARFQYASDLMGVASVHDKIAVLLGGATTVYFREIPMLTNYSTESRMAAYDEKWCWLLTRFTVPYDSRSKRAPSKSWATGEPCTIAAFQLSRLCFKRGRTSVTPERALAMSGFVGPEDAAADPLVNWRRAQGLRRKKGAVRAWLAAEEVTDEVADGNILRGGKERSRPALEIIARLHDEDRNVWLELDELAA